MAVYPSFEEARNRSDDVQHSLEVAARTANTAAAATAAIESIAGVYLGFCNKVAGPSPSREEAIAAVRAACPILAAVADQ
jgi:hypothetical protein